MSAKTLVGRGAAVVASPIAPPAQVPSSPQNVSVTVLNADSSGLYVTYDAPVSTGDSQSAILKYLIQYDDLDDFAGTSGNSGDLEIRCPNYYVKEVHTIEIDANGDTSVDSGSFDLQPDYNSATASTLHSIRYDAVAMAHEEDPTTDTYCNTNAIGSCTSPNTR